MQRPMFALGRSQTNLGMVFAVVLVLAAMVTGISASSAAAITLPSGYSERKVADVPLPTGLAFLPDGRMLVAGKDGRVWLIDRGKRRREAVMSLRARSCEERERGLSGIAVDPNFERNRFVYVYWTRRRGPTCPVEYTRGGLRPDHPVNRLSRYRLTRELGVDREKVNVNGGAIALGHPIGMSGARIVLHLAMELGRRGGGVGAAALCGGGGQGDALVLHVPARA